MRHNDGPINRVIKHDHRAIVRESNGVITGIQPGVGIQQLVVSPLRALDWVVLPLVQKVLVCGGAVQRN